MESIPSTDTLTRFSADFLKEICRRNNIRNYSKYNKANLVIFVRNELMKIFETGNPVYIPDAKTKVFRMITRDLSPVRSPARSPVQAAARARSPVGSPVRSSQVSTYVRSPVQAAARARSPVRSPKIIYGETVECFCGDPKPGMNFTCCDSSICWECLGELRSFSCPYCRKDISQIIPPEYIFKIDERMILDKENEMNMNALIAQLTQLYPEIPVESLYDLYVGGM